MSPEQWRGEKVDGRADQYALGVVAFELLTGKRPFATGSMQELLRMHLGEDPPDIISYRGDLPSHTTDAVWQAMAKDPAERFESATAFVDALSGGGAPRASGPPRVSTKAVSMPAAPSRNPWLVIALLLLLGGVAGAVVVSRMNARKNAALAAAPPAAAPAPPTASPLADSIAALEKVDADENAKLQKELADARQPGAHRRTQSGTALESRSGEGRRRARFRAGATLHPRQPRRHPHAHIIVIARGGTPRILVDGQPTVNSAPAVVEVPPGKHTVAVRGAPGNPFTPAEYNLDLAPNDTQQVVFVSPHAGLNEARRQRLLQAGDSLRKARKPPV